MRPPILPPWELPSPLCARASNQFLFFFYSRSRSSIISIIKEPVWFELFNFHSRNMIIRARTVQKECKREIEKKRKVYNCSNKFRVHSSSLPNLYAPSAHNPIDPFYLSNTHAKKKRRKKKKSSPPQLRLVLCAMRTPPGHIRC